MTKLNFKEFKLYKGIAKKEYSTVDVREVIADIIYNQATGIKMHSLSHKIYESEYEVEYSEDEVKIITSIADERCTPAFIDSLRTMVV